MSCLKLISFFNSCNLHFSTGLVKRQETLAEGCIYLFFDGAIELFCAVDSGNEGIRNLLLEFFSFVVEG